MKKIFVTLILSILILLPVVSVAYTAIKWDDMESHRWISVDFGGEAPSLLYDGTTFAGQTVLRLTFTGTGNYGFIHNDFFSRENWSNVTAVAVDVYYIDSTTGNSPTTKFEGKNDSDASYEFPVQGLAKGSWQTITWPLGVTYSTVSRVFLNIENISFSTTTVYFDNFRLVKNNGTTELWDDFNDGSKSYVYGGTYATDSFRSPVGVPDVISHNQQSTTSIHLGSPVNSTGAGAAFLEWDGADNPSANYAEVDDFNVGGANWSAYTSVYIDVYTNNAAVGYSIFLWDGTQSFQPPTQFVATANTWHTLWFDITGAHTGPFNINNIQQFKYVALTISTTDATSTGWVYFDNVYLSDSPNIVPVELSSFSAEVEESYRRE